MRSPSHPRAAKAMALAVAALQLHLLGIPEASSQPVAREGSGNAELSGGVVISKVWEDYNMSGWGEISSSGRFLSHVDWDTGDLAAYGLATGTSFHLTDKGSWNASSEFPDFSRWSPDSRRVAYAWYDGHEFHDIRVVGLDGSSSCIVYRGNEDVPYIRVFDWSPDGREILAFFYRRERTNQIVAVSVADGSVRVLKELDRRGMGYMPRNGSFSPDGRYITYDAPQREDPCAHDIFSVSADGASDTPLVEHPAHEYVIGWTEDGKHILFASERSGSVKSVLKVYRIIGLEVDTFCESDGVSGHDVSPPG